MANQASTVTCSDEDAKPWPYFLSDAFENSAGNLHSLLLAVACFGFPVVAEDAVVLASPDQDIDPRLSEMEALIQQLGSQSFAQRRAAFIELWRLGADALPAIQIARSSDNLQIAQAAAALEPIVVLGQRSGHLRGSL